MTAAFEEQLALITKLQEIDLNLHNLQENLDAIPEKLREVEIAYLEARTQFDAVKLELEEVEKAKRNDELELASSIERLRIREAKLYAIKTNKEYQAALKEVSDGKRANKEREDRILQAMEKIDTLTKKTTQLSTELADKENEYRTKKELVKAEAGQIESSMREQEKERPELSAKIEKAVIRKYEFVRQRYAKAVANVSGGVCQGCSRRIPPQLLNEMLRHDELKACPGCQRLIFITETPPVEAK